MMAPVPDSYLVSNFRVEIEGITVASFSEILGLDVSIDIVDYRTGSSPQTIAERLPGLQHFGNIILKRGFTQNIDLWNWVKTILAGVADKRTMSIVLEDAQHNDVIRWNFKNAWPCRWSGPVLRAGTSDIAIETLEICHEGFVLAVVP
jgi:phage tail-like protein